MMADDVGGLIKVSHANEPDWLWQWQVRPYQMAVCVSLPFSRATWIDC